jgi:hypothetical protein
VQAAAYLENSRDTFADYLAILRSDGLDLFDDPLSDAHDPLHGDPADAHRRTVVLAGARDLFARSFAIAEDLAKADPHPAQAQRDPSVSLGQLGVVEVQAGNVACARDLFAIAEDLAKADPHSAEAQRDLSVSPERLGSVEVQAGNLAGARDLLVRSLSLREDLVTPRRRSATSRSLARKWPRSIIRRRLHGYPAT